MPFKTSRKKTMLLFSNDADLLMVAQAALSGRNRILSAWSAADAAWILQRLPVDKVVIDSGAIDSRCLELACAERRIEINYMSALVDSGMLRATLPAFAQRAHGPCASATV